MHRAPVARLMDAWICGFNRSPFTPAHKGELRHVRPDEMLGQVVAECLKRTGLTGSDVDDIQIGCAYPEGEQGLNIGRIATYLSGCPVEVPGMTTNRLCGSSMQVVHTAAGQIARGWGDIILCGGVESMSRIKRGGFSRSPHPDLHTRFPDAYISMGETAENVADMCSIGRVRQEEFALASHQKASAALAEGSYSDAIIAIESSDGTIGTDGCIRAESTLEAMAVLRPAFRDGGSVTAATSSPLTDGAVCLIIASDAAVEKHGLKPMSRILSAAVTGCEPREMGLGPIAASRLALKRAGLAMRDIDVIELNEAFASQSLAVIDRLGLDSEKLNVDGGALAIGHPLGASGARLLGRAATVLRRTSGRYALATMCIGGGMGIATVLETFPVA